MVTIRYLGWAGIEIEAAGETIVVDAVSGWGVHTPFMGAPLLPLERPRNGASAALLTHLHLDHADPPLLGEILSPGAPVLRPAAGPDDPLQSAGTRPAEDGLAAGGLNQAVTGPWESHQVGPFTLTAVPASDGFGDPQVSWTVEAEGKRILHCGDTLFHGSWWPIRMRLGAIDAAFLPINGPVADLPHRQPASPLPVVMDGEQAAAAAVILEAGVAVPIHFRELNNPPVYVRDEDAERTFTRAAERYGAPARVMETDAELTV